jgi:hypothetical protein
MCSTYCVIKKDGNLTFELSTLNEGKSGKIPGPSLHNSLISSTPGRCPTLAEVSLELGLSRFLKIHSEFESEESGKLGQSLEFYNQAFVVFSQVWLLL